MMLITVIIVIFIQLVILIDHFHCQTRCDDLFYAAVHLVGANVEAV